ncbi:MAG: class I SAM-dependent methyltransferase [Planctomycetes bacterium]|nr:class I SAM-dependent methyltransferase [Planctomycetota bacterium]
MLRSTLEVLRCPACGQTMASAMVRALEEDAEGRLEEAVIRCSRCEEWVRVEGGIVDLLPPALADRAAREAFARRHGLLVAAPGEASDATASAQKRSQREFFEAQVGDYERRVVGHPYYRALDALTACRWARGLDAGSLVVDLCAGSGRITGPMAALGLRVVAVDISEAMLQRARARLADAGLLERVDLVLADAEALPLAGGSADAVLCYGGLHHLHSPARAVAEAGRVLRGGGRWFSLDPNASPMRWAFDLAMRVVRLWEEEASDHPLQDAGSLGRWCAAAGIEARVGYTTWLLPHLFGGLSVERAMRLLEASDRWFGRWRAVRRWAGAITVDGVKGGRAHAPLPRAAGADSAAPGRGP